MIVELIASFFLVTTVSSLRSNQGREFLLPFMDTGDSAVLVILTDEATEVVIEHHDEMVVHFLHSKTVIIPASKIGNDGAVNMSIQQEAVFVAASKDIWLYVLLNDLKSDHSGFIAIPLEHLSTNYTVVTYKQNENGFTENFVIIAAPEDNTTVAILVKTGANVFCKTMNASTSDIGILKLNRKDVAGFVCSGDITGTLIRSNKIIAVVSGQRSSSSGSSGGPVHNLMIEMMIPSNTFGREFILAAPEPEGSVIYRIVPSKTPSYVNTSNGETYDVDDLGFVDITSSSIMIETSSPCTVVAVNRQAYQSWDNTTRYIYSSMSLVPSTDQYLKWYVIEDPKYLGTFQDGDRVSIFTKDQGFGCSNIQQCDIVQMVMPLGNAGQASSAVDLDTPRGAIFDRVDTNGDITASFPLGMLFDTDECSSSPCYNNATCEDGSYSFVCHCLPGFNGTICDVDIDECLSNPCRNNGTCHDDINGFVCQCELGFSGTECEIEVDDCVGGGCQNNASCQEQINGFLCQCAPGFTGQICETDIDECLSSPCQNNATCQEKVNGFVCECQPGFGGDMCESDIDECLSTPCQNNATCQEKVNKFVCGCQPGFSGELCEEDINECLSNPCQNNATCEDEINGFVCLCRVGFHGTVCETVTDNCSSSPCKNRGTCDDSLGGFTCNCETGFYGTMCESFDYAYTYTRLISADKTLLTSTGQTVAEVPLKTDIRFETSYTNVVIRGTPVDHGASKYDCVCTRYGNSSEEEVDPKVLVDKIQHDLLLDKDKLIKTIIKYKSQEDDRPSAKGIGSMGCMVIIFSILVIVVPDVFYVLKQFDNSGRKGKIV